MEFQNALELDAGRRNIASCWGPSWQVRRIRNWSWEYNWRNLIWCPSPLSHAVWQCSVSHMVNMSAYDSTILSSNSVGDWPVNFFTTPRPKFLTNTVPLSVAHGHHGLSSAVPDESVHVPRGLVTIDPCVFSIASQTSTLMVRHQLLSGVLFDRSEGT